MFAVRVAYQQSRVGDGSFCPTPPQERRYWHTPQARRRVSVPHTLAQGALSSCDGFSQLCHSNPVCSTRAGRDKLPETETEISGCRAVAMIYVSWDSGGCAWVAALRAASRTRALWIISSLIRKFVVSNRVHTSGKSISLWMAACSNTPT